MFTVLSVLLIALPAWGWSYANMAINGYFTFSRVQEVDLAGKLFQYDMIQKGPDLVNGVDVKGMLLKYPDKEMDINTKIDRINASYDSDNSVDRRPFDFLLYDFSKITLLHNMPEYVMKTFMMIRPGVIEMYSLDVNEIGRAHV